MDRRELKQILRREGVHARSYSLAGGLPDEKYCLEQRDERWFVYGSERGQRVDERQFATEDEACRYLLELLRRDPNTRWEPPATRRPRPSASERG